MEAYEVLGEMLRALLEAFPGTDGEWKSTIGRVPMVQRRWWQNSFCFELALITINGENRFKVTLEIEYRGEDFKPIMAEKPTPAEAISEALAQWKNFCDPRVAAPAPAVVGAVVAAEED
jgi:hypothetical protein